MEGTSPHPTTLRNTLLRGSVSTSQKVRLPSLCFQLLAFSFSSHHFCSSITVSRPLSLLQPLPDSASTYSSMTSTQQSHPGSASSTTSRSATGPLVSRLSSVATVGRKAPSTSVPVGGTCTSSLWLTVNWRPSVSLPGTTSRKVSDHEAIRMRRVTFSEHGLVC